MRCVLASSASIQHRSRLPQPLTPFVGRYDEIETISELLARPDVRLLTLTGPGGIGKTRLSIEVAARLRDHARFVTHFVTLASVLNAEDAFWSIAEALCVWDAQKADLVQRTAHALHGESTLLVLDNLEHVIEVAVDISQLLPAAPDLTILATSRTPLHIQGEREYSVPQLTMADPDEIHDPEDLLEHESIALFVDRAQAVDRTFALSADNAQIIAQICTRLDGVPLAIELAAAKIKTLPPAALLGRLDNQLRVLRSDSRDLPDRLQTMRSTIDWSYKLLGQDEQQAFRLLSVFTGGFSLDAAGAVLAKSENEVIDIVESLIDKSLIASRGQFDESPYYQILAVLREFGLERLDEAGDSEQARLRHAEYVARMAEESFVHQFNADQPQIFRSLDRIHVNIRQALNWTMATERWELAARIAAHLWQYWVVRGNFAEGYQWFERLLEQDVDYPRKLLPNLYFGHAFLAGKSQDVKRDAALARRLVQIGEDTGDRRILATGTALAGLRPWDTNGMTESLAAIELWNELNEPIWEGRAAGEVSRVAREMGDLDSAEAYAYQAYETVRGTGHIWGIAQTTAGVGRILAMRGKTNDALTMLKKALALVSGIGDWILVLRILEFLIDVAGSQNQNTRVVRLSSATSNVRQKIGYDIRYSFEQREVDKRILQARSALGEDRFNHEWLVGQQLTFDAAIAEAMAIETEIHAPAEMAVEGFERLSRREREVLQHIVTGQTDQQIADELFVSYRTVTTHVTNILNKLGAGSRTEAAAIAVRDSLI